MLINEMEVEVGEDLEILKEGDFENPLKVWE